MANQLGDPKLRLDGMDLRFMLLIDDKPVAASQVQFESGEIAEKATMHEDKLMGDDMDQHDKRVRGHTFRGTFFCSDASLIEAIRLRDQKKLARQPAGSMGIAFLLAERDGAFEGYSLANFEGSWNWNFAGSDQRIKISVNGSGREFSPVQGL